MNTSMRSVDRQAAHMFGSLQAKVNGLIRMMHALPRVLREVGHALSVTTLGISHVIIAVTLHLEWTP
jgi:hypothetical protein